MMNLILLGLSFQLLSINQLDSLSPNNNQIFIDSITGVIVDRDVELFFSLYQQLEKSEQLDILQDTDIQELSIIAMEPEIIKKMMPHYDFQYGEDDWSLVAEAYWAILNYNGINNLHSLDVESANAIMKEHFLVVDLLNKGGADLNFLGSGGFSCLTVGKSNYFFINLLVEHGFDINQKYENGHSLFTYLLEDFFHRRTFNFMNTNVPLEENEEKEYEEKLTLIEKLARKGGVTNNKEPFLHFLLFKAIEMKKYKVLVFLLKREGIDVPMSKRIKNREGDSLYLKMKEANMLKT